MTSASRKPVSKTVRVALVGRASSGKTTLARTLLRKSVGRVTDEPNATEKPYQYLDNDLGVYFVDCPGFQDAGTYRAYRILRGQDPVNADRIRAGADFSLEDRAIHEIESCDVQLYVGSLEAVPNHSHAQEIALLTDFAPIVGVLNMVADTASGWRGNGEG